MIGVITPRTMHAELLTLMISLGLITAVKVLCTSLGLCVSLCLSAAALELDVGLSGEQAETLLTSCGKITMVKDSQGKLGNSSSTFPCEKSLIPRVPGESFTENSQ